MNAKTLSMSTQRTPVAEETRQYARAAAEGNFFVAQTVANNAKRSATATAVIGLTSASEIARVDAHTDIDNTLQLPWSQYLVDAATARLAWWNTTSTQYADLASDRNTAESTYTGRLATAHVSRQQFIATAKKSESIIDANSGAAQATAQADAVRDYFTNMVAPTKTYVDALATAERTKAVAIAQANRDYIDHESYSQRQNDIQTANDTFDSSRDDQAATYRSALADEQADQYLDFATADFNRTIALVAADVSLVTTRNSAENGYRNEESAAYLQSATSWANIDAAYRQYEANSFASAAASLAANDPSPWAGYDAGFYNAQASQVTAVSNAAKTDAIAEATSQKSAEITQRNGETAWRNAYATADGILKSLIAAAQKGWATAQSTAYADAGGSDLVLPTVYQPDELTGEYTVDAPVSNYRTTIYSASNNAYAHYYNNYWWGAWGYYGSGYWYSSYYGYGGYPYTGYHINLSQPSNQFAPAFWQIDGNEAANQTDGGAVQARYGDATSEQLVAPDGVPEGALNLPPSIKTKVSDGVNHTNGDIIAILSRLDEQAGEYWTLYGSVDLTTINPRPEPVAEQFTNSLLLAQMGQRNPGLRDQPQIHAGTSVEASSLGISVAAGRRETSMEVAFAAGHEVVNHDEELEYREKEFHDKLQRLLSDGISLNGQNVSNFANDVYDGFVDGVKNGLGGMLVNTVYYLATDGVGDFFGFAWQATKTSASFVYHTAQYTPGIRQAGSLVVGYDIGANEEQAVREFADSATTSTLRAVEWTTENIEYLENVLGEVGNVLAEGGEVLISALMTGDTEKLDAIMDSLGAKSSVISREVMHLTRQALVEIGHAVLDLESEQAGYIVGAVAYEATETLVLIAIETGLAALAVGSGGTAAPAAVGGTTAIVSAKAASFSKLVYRLSKQADLVNLPKVARAIDRLNELAVWMIKYPMCFVAGTKIHTQDGLINIEEIRRGDLVLTRDEKDPSSENRYRRVTELFTTNPKRLLTIRFRNNINGSEEELTCTGEHPFYVAGRSRDVTVERAASFQNTLSAITSSESQIEAADPEIGGFLPANDLAAGDILVLANGNEATITFVNEKVADPGESFTTYNLAVENYHTYFVGESGTWVHNTGNPCDEAFDTFAKMVANGSHYTEAYTEALRGLLKYDDGPALIRKHAADLDNFITQGYKRALINDYALDIDPDFAEFVAKNKWVADDHHALHWSQLPEDLRHRGIGLRTPKGGIIEEHHLLPQADEFKAYWSRPEINIDIEDFKIARDKTTHRGADVGLHSTGWDDDWRVFLSKNPTKIDIFKFASRMVKKYAID